MSLFVLATALAALAPGQMKVRLAFPDAGVREVWVGSGLPDHPPPSPEKLDGRSFEYALPAYGPDDRLFVLDAATGNLAAKPISEIQGEWNVAPAEFKRIGRLEVRVEHEGKPVAAADVSVSDGKRRLERILDPSTKGVLVFCALEPGPISVTVRYNTEGRPADPLKQTVDVPLKRDKAVPTIVASLPDPVAVVEDAPAGSPPAGTAPSQPSPAVAQPNPFGATIVYLVVLAAALAGGYYLLQLMRKNPEIVKDRLEKMGVDLPEPQAPEPDDDAPPMPRAPEPPQQILLGGAPPEPAPAVPPSAPATAAGQPRLVASDGRLLEIPEGLSVVGREEGLPLALVGETTVSRRHAEIVRDGATVSVHDLGSTNGTFVNGSKVEDEIELRHGDEVQFGAVRFRYEG